MTEPPTDPTPPSPEAGPAEMVEEALRDAGGQVEAMNDTAASAAGSVELPDFGAGGSDAAAAGIGMLGDVDLDVRIELGRTSMLVDDVLKLSPDSVVELDKAAGDPVDIFVNGRHVARGEVLVLNENFCVRVSEIVGKIPEASSG
ncbi:MAG: flagellar motor switch protein FliN [Planctomycetaceae bacterium]|nr:flagellar motor switch protein FliN [Planctomycetaceae bacterium]